MTRFAAVYFFLVFCLLGGLFDIAYVRYPGNPVASDALSAALIGFVPTSIVAACLYVDLSVAAALVS